MSREADLPPVENGDGSGENYYDGNNYVVDIYPLNRYYFGSKEAVPFKDESAADRLLRMKLKYVSVLPVAI